MTHFCCCYCSVTQSYLTFCDPVDCSMPGFSVLHNLPEFAQTDVYWVGDAIQLSHPMLFPLLLPSVLPSIRVFSNESALRSSGWSAGTSASASILPMNIQSWFPLELTGWISLQSKRFSNIFSNTAVWKYQLFNAQLSLWPNSHICAWVLDKTIALTIQTFE